MVGMRNFMAKPVRKQMGEGEMGESVLAARETGDVIRVIVAVVVMAVIMAVAAFCISLPSTVPLYMP